MSEPTSTMDKFQVGTLVKNPDTAQALESLDRRSGVKILLDL